MSKIKETIKTTGIRVQRAYTEVLDSEAKTGKKYEARSKIENEIFDFRDSIADNSKFISLIFAMGAEIYDVLTDSQKNNIPEATRDVIEFAIKEYRATETWGDLQLKSEGTEAIKKLLGRQTKIANVIKDIYKI